MAYIQELGVEAQVAVNKKTIYDLTKERVAMVDSHCGKMPCKPECMKFIKENNLVYFFEGICGGMKTEAERQYLAKRR